MLLVERFVVLPRPSFPPAAEKLPRPKFWVFMVCTCAFPAPPAGVVRAITERFCMVEEGLATLLRRFCAPNELCRVGVTDK